LASIAAQANPEPDDACGAPEPTTHTTEASGQTARTKPATHHLRVDALDAPAVTTVTAHHLRDRKGRQRNEYRGEERL
jgi:hypothetical protein